MKKQTILIILFSLIVSSYLISLLMFAAGHGIDNLKLLSIPLIFIIITALVDKYYNPVKKEKDIVLESGLNKLLDNKIYFRTGLCDWIHQLYLKNIITYDEYHEIFDLMLDKGIKISKYHWEPGLINPRIKWIKKQIRNL